MAFFPHVNRGETFQPNSVLENNVRDAVNGHLATGDRVTRGNTGNSIRVPVWNTTDKELPAGSAVAIFVDEQDKSAAKGVLPCEPFDGDNRPWGVLVDSLPKGAVGDCIIGGIATITLSKSVEIGDRILPVAEKDKPAKDYAPVPNGPARVIHADGKKAIILFDGGDAYFGYFKLVLMKTSGSAPDSEISDSSSSSSSSSSSCSSSSSSSSSSSDDSSSSSDHSSSSPDDSSSDSDPTHWPSGSGILGLSNGRLVLYPTGSCKSDDDDSDDDSSHPHHSNSDDSSSDYSSSSPDHSSSSPDDSSSASSSSSDSSSDDSSSSSSSSSDSSSDDSSDSDDSSSSGGSDGDELMLAVVDGANPSAGNCGFVDMGSTRINVPRACFSGWDKKRTLYVYLQTGGRGISVKMATEYPQPTREKFRRLLGRLVYRNGAYSVIQEQHGPVIENYHMVIGGLGYV